MIFIIDKIYPHSHPLQISDFRFQISDFEWPIFRAAEASFLPGISGMQRRKIPKITIHNILFYRKLKKTNRILDKP